ncbi:MAG: mycofactocin biosynthesis chaperone MftB [Acidimicrobiia bacterium]
MLEAPTPTREFDPGGSYVLHPRVALRPEPFGALAYHYGNRRLTFVKSFELVELLRGLGRHSSVDAALDDAGIHGQKRDSCVRALARLAEAEVIHAFAR